MSLVPVPAVLALAAAVTALATAAAVPTLRRSLRPRAVSTRSLPRVVAETVIVVLAAGTIVLMRRRGLVGESTGESRFDPLLAAGPALVGLAIAIALLRVYPVLIRRLARLAARRRDIVPFVGATRVLLQAPAGRLQLLVIMLAMAVAVFTAVLSHSIEEGQRRSTWHEVGADFRVVTPGGLPDFAEVSRAVEAVALGVRIEQVAPRSAAMSVPTRLDFLAVDVEDYERVVAGTPAAPDLAGTLIHGQPTTDIGTAANPIEVIASARWADTQAASIGAPFSMVIGARRTTFVVSAVRDVFPSMRAERPFVVANLASLTAAGGALRATDAFIRGTAAAEVPLEGSLVLGSSLHSRRALFSAAHDDPFSVGLRRTFAGATALAVVFALTAAAAGPALDGQSRRRQLTYLRTMGLSTRQAMAVTAIEHTVPIAVAGMVGSLLGVGSAVFFEPGIDLEAFTGGALPGAVLIDPGPILIATGALTAAGVLAAAVYGLVGRRADVGRVLRVGDE